MKRARFFMPQKTVAVGFITSPPIGTFLARQETSKGLTDITLLEITEKVDTDTTDLSTSDRKRRRQVKKDPDEEEEEEEEEELKQETVSSRFRDSKVLSNLNEICLICDEHCLTHGSVGCRGCGRLFHKKCWAKYIQFVRYPCCLYCHPEVEKIYGCPFGCFPKKAETLLQFKNPDKLDQLFGRITTFPSHRRFLIDQIQAHFSSKHRQVTCTICNSTVLRQNAKSHRARECGENEIMCPTEGCETIIDRNLHQATLRKPSALLSSYHQCQNLYRCDSCSTYFITSEKYRRHSTKCIAAINNNQSSTSASQQRPTRRAAKNAKLRITFTTAMAQIADDQSDSSNSSSESE